MSDLADDVRVDVVMYPSGVVKAVPAGKGADIVRSYHERPRTESTPRQLLMWAIVALILGYSLLVVRNLLLGILAAGIVYLAFRLVPRLQDSDAALLDDDVALADAREQWGATPVRELTGEAEAADEWGRRRGHAVEGEAG